MDLDYFVRFFRTLLPKSRLFALAFGSRMRQLVEGLAVVPLMIHQHFSQMLLDLLPYATDRLDEWKKVFNLPVSATADDVAAAWKEEGGQSPEYIQRRIRDLGIDIYVHEAVDPATGLVRDPTPHIERYGFDMGSYFFGWRNLLVNKRSITVPRYLDTCDNGVTQCDNGVSQCDRYDILIDIDSPHIVHYDADEYPYYWYAGGAVWPDTVAMTNRNFDRLRNMIYRIKPLRTRAVCLVALVADLTVYDTIDGVPHWQDTIDGTPVYQDFL